MLNRALSIAPRQAEILLVEDDEGDALLTRKALEAGPVAVSITHVEDGETALRFLHHASPEFKDAPRPDIILLDLNLPGLQGQDVLEDIKGDPALKRIPVIVLTSSQAESDILRSYDLHSNAYMVKPGDPDIFQQVAETLEDFWLKTVILARR